MLGDWAPGTTIRPSLVNITFDSQGKLNHVGVGYRVYAPSGQYIKDGGWTWTPPPEHEQPLLDAMVTLMSDLADSEGVSVDWQKEP